MFATPDVAYSGEVSLVKLLEIGSIRYPVLGFSFERVSHETLKLSNLTPKNGFQITDILIPQTIIELTIGPPKSIIQKSFLRYITFANVIRDALSLSLSVDLLGQHLHKLAQDCKPDITQEFINPKIYDHQKNGKKVFMYFEQGIVLESNSQFIVAFPMFNNSGFIPFENSPIMNIEDFRNFLNYYNFQSLKNSQGPDVN